jgi:hypothetical protein
VPTLTSTFDCFIGTTTATSSFDAVLVKSNTVTSTFDAQVVKSLWSQFDALIVDSRGSFRGTGTTADRDALESPQPGDVYIVTNP